MKKALEVSDSETYAKSMAWILPLDLSSHAQPGLHHLGHELDDSGRDAATQSRPVCRPPASIVAV